jgi:hypothetical protein
MHCPASYSQLGKSEENMHRILRMLPVLASLLMALATAAYADEPGFNLDLRAGPAVWKEEYWDIEPQDLGKFLDVYRQEVYGIERHISGYRGYTVLTSIPAKAQATPVAAAHSEDSLIRSHYGIRLEGKTLTERSINVGKLIGATHNVIVIHHFATWADADKAPAAFAKAYADKHNGADVWEHLAATLFPLANNYWETYFRLVTTGFPTNGTATGEDADNFNLEPRPEPSRMVKEYWDVTPENLSAFLKAYADESYPTTRQVRGHRGVSIITTFPPGPHDAPLTALAKKNFPLGGPPEFYVPQRGVMMDRTIRTDRSINFSSVFRSTFTVITYHHMATGADRLMGDVLQQIYGAQHNGADRLEVMRRDFFPYARNHWDMSYRVLETSFTPQAAK